MHRRKSKLHDVRSKGMRRWPSAKGHRTRPVRPWRRGVSSRRVNVHSVVNEWRLSVFFRVFSDSSSSTVGRYRRTNSPNRHPATATVRVTSIVRNAGAGVAVRRVFTQTTTNNGRDIDRLDRRRRPGSARGLSAGPEHPVGVVIRIAHRQVFARAVQPDVPRPVCQRGHRRDRPPQEAPAADPAIGPRDRARVSGLERPALGRVPGAATGRPV